MTKPAMHATPSHDPRRIVVAVLAIVTIGWLAACTGDNTSTSGTPTAPTDPTPVNTSNTTTTTTTNTGSTATSAGSDSDTAARDPDNNTTDTAPVDTAYDETDQTPLDELPDKVAEIVTAQAGDDTDTATIECIIDELLTAYDNGDLTAHDLDAYVRLNQVTEPITTLLQQLQANGTCTP